ncbi:MAG: pilus assembly protein PilM [Methylococcaceae bacterium]|nr:pilus assembly protein PilM [Methylococcaceae bacterium]
MNLLPKLFGKKPICQGIVGISFLQKGIAIAIAKFTDNKTLKLVHCEFITSKNEPDETILLGSIITKFRLFDYDCHVVLTSDKYRHINIDAPSVAEHELGDAIRWKISDLVEFAVDKAVIDFYPMPPTQRANSNKMLEVIASPGDQINVQADKCLKAGLQLKVIDIQEMTLRNLAMQLPENHRGVAILRLSELSGLIVIEKSGTIYLSRQFDTGYKNLGLDTQPFGGNKLSTLVQGNLALEIQRSLDYVESYYGIPPISCLAIIPLAEHTENLREILTSNLGITTRILELSAIVDSEMTLDNQTLSHCAPAIGAALRHVEATL